MGVAVLKEPTKANALHQIFNTLLNRLFSERLIEHPPLAVDFEGFTDYCPYRHTGVEGGVGVLENHLHIFTGVEELIL